MRWYDKLKAFFLWILSGVNILLFAALSYRWFLSETIDGPPMTRGDYLDLMLTLLGLLLTAITIILAIAAFFAYFDLRRAAENMAEKTTRDVLATQAQIDQPSKATPQQQRPLDAGPGVERPTAEQQLIDAIFGGTKKSVPEEKAEM